MAEPLASFENTRFHGPRGAKYTPGNGASTTVNVDKAEAAKTINDTLAAPGLPIGHSQANQKKLAPARQQDILVDRVPLDAAIIADKDNQEIQQTSRSTTSS